jgi:hypothetical protein
MARCGSSIKLVSNSSRPFFVRRIKIGRIANFGCEPLGRDILVIIQVFEHKNYFVLRRLGTKLEYRLLTPLMPSVETDHPNYDTAGLGSPQSAPLCRSA